MKKATPMHKYFANFILYQNFKQVLYYTGLSQKVVLFLSKMLQVLVSQRKNYKFQHSNIILIVFLIEFVYKINT